MSENITSGNGNLPLTTKKVQKLVKTCQNLPRSYSTIFLELTEVISLPSFTLQAGEPASIQLRFIKQQQIVYLREKMNYQSVLTLSTKSRTELTWWVENLRFWNGGTFSQLNPQIIIQKDVSLPRWRVACNGDRTSRQWSEEVRTFQIVVLELLEIKFALFSFESHTLLDRQQGSLVLLSERQQCSLVFSFEDGRKKERKNWWNKY